MKSGLVVTSPKYLLANLRHLAFRCRVGMGMIARSPRCSGLLRIWSVRVWQAFYDSKACLCAFEFAPGFDLKGHIAEIVLSCAKSHISQFIWDGRYEQSDAFDDMGNED